MEEINLYEMQIDRLALSFDWEKKNQKLLEKWYYIYETII